MYSWNNKNNDWWDKGVFETVEECIKEAVEEYEKKPGDTIEIGMIYPYEPQVDIENMLERMEEQAYEECGEAAESWQISYRQGHEKEWEELGKGVQALVEKYFNEIGEKPNFYRVGNIHTVRV